MNKKTSLGIPTCAGFAPLMMRIVIVSSVLIGLVLTKPCFADASVLFSEVDLDIGETSNVVLPDGTQVALTLQSVDDLRDPIRDAVRSSRIVVDVDGQTIELASGNYNLPQRVGAFQIDCAVTSGCNSNGSPESWGLDKSGGGEGALRSASPGPASLRDRRCAQLRASSSRINSARDDP